MFRKNYTKPNMKLLLKAPNSLSLTIRGHCSWQTSWTAGDRGHQELCGAELEATYRERPWGCHVLCGKGEFYLFYNQFLDHNLSVKTATCQYFSDRWISVCQCVTGTDSWQRVNTEIPVKSPRFALFDLAEGKSYSFRVRCCNSAGVGEPSDPTEATTVGDKLG